MVEVGVITVPEVWICKQMNIEAGDKNANRMVPYAICTSNPREGIFTNSWSLLGIVDDTKGEYDYPDITDVDSELEKQIAQCSPKDCYVKLMYKKGDPRATAMGIGYTRVQRERAAKIALAVLQYLRKSPVDRSQFRFEADAEIQSQFWTQQIKLTNR